MICASEPWANEQARVKAGRSDLVHSRNLGSSHTHCYLLVNDPTALGLENDVSYQ